VDVPGFLALFYVVAIHRKSLHGTYRPENILSARLSCVKGKTTHGNARVNASSPCRCPVSKETSGNCYDNDDTSHSEMFISVRPLSKVTMM
jgi:hypothetical protein